VTDVGCIVPQNNKNDCDIFYKIIINQNNLLNIDQTAKMLFELSEASNSSFLLNL